MALSNDSRLSKRTPYHVGFACNYRRTNRIDATDVLTKPFVQSVAHVPLKEEWVTMVSQAQHQFRGSDLSKVVLARQSQVEFDQELNPFCLMTFIQANDPGLIHFVEPLTMVPHSLVAHLNGYLSWLIPN